MNNALYMNYIELVDVVEVGRIITVDNGLMNFRVLQKRSSTHLRSHRWWHARKPQTCQLAAGSISEPTRHYLERLSDIALGMANDADFIALSFVRSPDDVVELQQLLAASKESTKIIAKIEDQEGVNNIHQIVAVADGVMVARGDLGIETDIADCPMFSDESCMLVLARVSAASWQLTCSNR